MRSQVSCTLDSAPGDGEWLHSIYSQSLDDTKLMNLCKLCVSIFYLFFVFSNKKKKKKSFKNEKGHAGHTWRYWSNASAHFACCRPLLYSYATVSAPARVQQHVPSALSCTPSSLRFLFFFFFFNCLTHRHSRTQSAFSKSKRSHLKLLRWLLYGCVCVFSPSLYSLTVVYFVVLSGVPYCVCFL